MPSHRSVTAFEAAGHLNQAVTIKKLAYCGHSVRRFNAYDFYECIEVFRDGQHSFGQIGVVHI